MSFKIYFYVKMAYKIMIFFTGILFEEGKVILFLKLKKIIL
jgi:hypothetical protein